MQKIVKIALIIIGLVSAALWYFLPSGDFTIPEVAAQAADSGAMNSMFFITFVLIAIAVVVALFFTLKNLFSTPDSLKKTLFSILGFLLVVVISYFISNGNDLDPEFLTSMDATTSTVKKIGTGIYTFLILAAVAVILMIVPTVKKLIGK
tara:strand:+ start:4282 stop:4731 length:450 start_codon:yes stop_codon:yes gene_type:complete